MRKNSKGFVPILVLVLLVLIAVGYSVYRYSKTLPKPSPIASSVAHTITPSQTPSVTGVITTDTKTGLSTYKSSKYGYSLMYPSHYEAGGSGGTLKEPSFLIGPYDVGTMGAPGLPIFYVTVLFFQNTNSGKLEFIGGYNVDTFSSITPSSFNGTQGESGIWNMKVGSTVSKGDYTFTRYPDVIKDGTLGRVFEGTDSFYKIKEKRIFFLRQDGTTYMVGAYELNGNFHEFDKIYETFKFTN